LFTRRAKAVLRAKGGGDAPHDASDGAVTRQAALTGNLRSPSQRDLTEPALVEGVGGIEPGEREHEVCTGELL
jgi:hypothetical protein